VDTFNVLSIEVNIMDLFAMCLQVNVSQLQLATGKTINANKFGKADAGADKLELTSDEQTMIQDLKKVWAGILNVDVELATDFFKSGAGSMDVVR